MEQTYAPWSNKMPCRPWWIPDAESPHQDLRDWVKGAICHREYGVPNNKPTLLGSQCSRHLSVNHQWEMEHCHGDRRPFRTWCRACLLRLLTSSEDDLAGRACDDSFVRESGVWLVVTHSLQCYSYRLEEQGNIQAISGALSMPSSILVRARNVRLSFYDSHRWRNKTTSWLLFQLNTLQHMNYQKRSGTEIGSRCSFNLK